MIYPVKIKDAEGKVKEEITTEMLSRRHWRKFNDPKTPQTHELQPEQLRLLKELRKYNC